MHQQLIKTNDELRAQIDGEAEEWANSWEILQEELKKSTNRFDKFKLEKIAMKKEIEQLQNDKKYLESQIREKDDDIEEQKAKIGSLNEELRRAKDLVVDVAKAEEIAKAKEAEAPKPVTEVIIQAQPKKRRVLWNVLKEGFSWWSSSEFCIHKGQTLCSHDELCEESNIVGGEKNGDYWSPILDEENDWVALSSDPHGICTKHSDLPGQGGQGPSWGMEEKISAVKKYVSCCETEAFWNFESIFSWESAADFCKKSKRTLCTFEDICGPLGRKGSISGGMRSGGNLWAPVVDKANEWVKINNVTSPVCELWSDKHKSAEWGTDMKENEKKKWFACC